MVAMHGTIYVKTMKIRYATISKTGRRSNNEDCFNVLEMPEHNRFMGIVCDGMGGHSFGEVASETVCDAITRYWQKNTEAPDSETKVVMACKKACNAINQKSYELSHTEMGSTMVMVSIEDDKATIAHVGDSRCYLQRHGEGLLYQAEDHVRIDFGWEIVSRCFFSYRPEVAVPDIRQFTIQKGDRLLLCSDGLYKSMTPDILQARMMDNKPLEDILDEFDTLCRKQSDDNYTAILIEIE